MMGLAPICNEQQQTRKNPMKALQKFHRYLSGFDTDWALKLKIFFCNVFVNQKSRKNHCY